ncbi:MAG: hypothetical protein V4598_17855 [Bdellovibrionota bacterium]
MKILTYVLCLTLSLQSFAQTVDNTDSLDSTFQETTQLTDAQNDESQTFVHKGIQEKKIKEGCDNKQLKGCDPNIGGGLEDQIGKMYVLLFGLGPMFMKGAGGGSSAAAPAAPAPATAPGTTPAATPKAQGKDYCIYIPIAYEAISMLTQMGGQKQASQETANLDPQLAALAQLKEAHKTRKKTATQQSVAYGVTTACYAGMLLTQTLKPDVMTIAKMAGAGALTTLYMSKAKKHGNAAAKVQEVIDSLPKAGDCNPWTGTSCFCAEKTSAKLYPGQFNEVCVLNKGKFDGPLSNFGCAVQTAGKVALDASCGCKKTNTCLSSKISIGKASLGLGANFVNDANAGLQLLDPSNFDEAKLNAFQANLAGKLAKVNIKGDAIPDVKLNPTQKAAADSLTGLVPPAIANLAAAGSPSGPPSGGLMGGSTSSALDKIPAALRKEMKDFEVSGGYRGNGGFSPTSAAAESSFSLPGMQPANPEGGVQVEEYAEKALSNADVRNAPETAIFDIISNRYRSSAWKRLEAQE